MKARIGSIVIGINRYDIALPQSAHGAQGLENAELEYAEQDAKEFRQYILTSWPGLSVDANIGLFGSEATLSAITNAAKNLQNHGAFDLFFVYIAGHGKRDTQGHAWFLTADARPETPDLDAVALEALLQRIRSRQLLLFLDCCYSERILYANRLFTNLDDAQARLFICSSRSDQLTWEDKRIRHGIFSAFLLDALNAGLPGRKNRAAIDVDSELFPYLCEQVPLYVYNEKKGHPQEPVKGGIAREKVQLPIGSLARRAGDQTVLATVKRGVQRVLMALVSLVFIGIVFIYLLLFHAIIAPDGHVVLQHGIREFDSLIPYRFRSYIETDLTNNDFTVDADQTVALRNGSVWGIWLHRDRDGYRRWIRVILPFLRESSKTQVLLQLTGELPASFLNRPTNIIQAWPAKLVSESLVLDPSNPTERLRWLRRSMPRSQDSSAGQVAFNPNYLDFSILGISHDQMVTYLQALAMSALVDPDGAFHPFEDALRIVRERAYHRRDDAQAREELEGLARILQCIGASRCVHRHASLDPGEAQELLKLADEGYGPWATVPMAYLGQRIPQEEVRSRLIETLRTSDRVQQGTPLTPVQEVILDALGQTIGDRPNDSLVIQTVMNLILRKDKNIENYPDLIQFLLSVAPHVTLPSHLRAILFMRVLRPHGQYDFFGLDALRILGANTPHLSSREVETLEGSLRIVERRYKNNIYILANTYGSLGFYNITNLQIVQDLDRAIEPDRRPMPSSSDDEQPVGMVIKTNDDEQAAQALGKIAQRRELSEKLFERLYRTVRNRPTISDRDTIILGLAHQRFLTGKEIMDANGIRSYLAQQANDAVGRSLECDIAVARLLALPRSRRNQLLRQMEFLRDSEEEVEIRLALSRIIIGTRLAMDLEDAGFQGTSGFALE